MCLLQQILRIVALPNGKLMNEILNGSEKPFTGKSNYPISSYLVAIANKLC
ncbi:MAG: hypothetical protein R2847_12375 [Bacteroidia bacterium]